jgi:tetratricopeptide (TPR) repeat protein
MRLPFLFTIIATFLLQAPSSVAQQAMGINPTETAHRLASLDFQQDRWASACPEFAEWRERLRDRPDLHFTSAQQEVIFNSLLCGLRQGQPQAAQDALQFLSSVPLRMYQDRLHAALADHYFRIGQWASCIEQYAKAGVVHFSNDEIAAAQFQQGYAHFVLQQYKEAKTFFNSVRSLPQGPFKSAATYYHALLLVKERSWDEALLQLRLIEYDSTYGTYTPYYIAQLLLSNGQPDETIQYVNTRLQRVPFPYHQAELQQLLGRSYFLSQNYQQAIVHLSAFAEKTDALSREDAYQLAYSHYQTGAWSVAERQLQALSTTSDSLGQHALFLLGDVYLKRGDLAAARSAFLFCSLHSVHSQQREAARFFHAKLSYQLGFFDEALSGLQSFITTYPNASYVSEARELQLAVLAATSNYKDALQLLDQLTLPSEPARRLFAPVLYGRAAELINDGELRMAEDLLDRALSDPYHSSLLAYLLFWKGELSFRAQRYQEAVEFFQQYLQKGAPSFGEVRPDHARYGLAYSYMRLERYDQALPLLTSLTGQVQANAGLLVQDALVRQADCLLMLRRYGQAAAIYKRVMDFSWREADYALYQLATITGIKDPAEKIKLLKLFETSFPGSSLLTASWMAIADTYMEEERFALAKPFLEKIIANEKSMQLLPQAHSKLGIAHYNSDNNDLARQQFMYILDQFSNSEEAADAVENLKAIYVEEGRSAEFISLLQSRGLSISASAEDSLLFAAAEQLYTQRSYDLAAQALEQYLAGRGRPAFALDAYAMLAALALQGKDLAKALSYYDSVLAVAPNRHAEEAALQAARICFFEQKNYDRAALYYGRLYELTGLSSSKLEALRGLLRAYYQLGQLDQAAVWGALLVNEKGTSSDDKALVALVAAKNFVLQSKEQEAQFSLRQVISINKASLAAEARYELAASHFRQQQYEAAEKAAFETIQKSGSYENWVTRSYLLLGDIYFAQQDLFNAKATYQSVKDNAVSDEYRKIAADKLEQVQKAASSKELSPQKEKG